MRKYDGDMMENGGHCRAHSRYKYPVGRLRVAIMKEAGKLVNQSEMAMDILRKPMHACDQTIRN